MAASFPGDDSVQLLLLVTGNPMLLTAVPTLPRVDPRDFKGRIAGREGVVYLF